MVKHIEYGKFQFTNAVYQVYGKAPFRRLCSYYRSRAGRELHLGEWNKRKPEFMLFDPRGAQSRVMKFTSVAQAEDYLKQHFGISHEFGKTK